MEDNSKFLWPSQKSWTLRGRSRIMLTRFLPYAYIPLQSILIHVFQTSNFAKNWRFQDHISPRDHSSITSACFWLFKAHPPTYVSINSTVNWHSLPFSDPTNPPLCWRNTWMVPKQHTYVHISNKLSESQKSYANAQSYVIWKALIFTAQSWNMAYLVWKESSSSKQF